MSMRYKIGQLARAGEVRVSTVRHYERIGLLKPAGRTAHNYRFYDQGSVERLRFIRAAQRLGLSLDDVAALLRYSNAHEPPCEEVQGLIERRLTELDRRMEDLRRVRAVLHSSLESCRAGEREGICSVLNALAS